MRLVLENVQAKHYKLLLEMARLLKFRIGKAEITEEEEDASIIKVKRNTSLNRLDRDEY